MWSSDAVTKCRSAAGGLAFLGTLLRMSPHFHETNDGSMLLGCDASFYMTAVGFRLSHRAMLITRRSRNQGAPGKDRGPGERRAPVFKQALTPARLPLFDKWAVPLRSDSYWPNTQLAWRLLFVMNRYKLAETLQRLPACACVCSCVHVFTSVIHL